MSQHSFLKNSNSTQQITIQEAPSEEYLDFQNPIQQKLFESQDQQHGRWVEELKINRQKLFKYSNIPQNNHILQPLNHKHQTNSNYQNKVVPQNKQLYHTPSIKTLKNIKHKITHNSTRLKSQEDKENEYKAILPKVNFTNNKNCNSLNKTTSVLSLKDIKGLGNSNKSKGGASSRAFCMKGGVKSTRFFDNSKASKTTLQRNQSKEALSRAINKTSSLSKFRYLAASEADNQLSIDPTQIIAALGIINEKQELLSQQKLQLEEKTKQLRENIERQQHMIEEIARNKEKMNHSMTRQEQLSRYSLDGAKLYKKKLQNCQLDARTMEGKLSEVTQENTKLSQAINQQKELIGMYESVIEELKCQLKIEKQAKTELQKKVAIAKKTLKSTESKANTHQSQTKQLFHKIFVSLDRWQ